MTTYFIKAILCSALFFIVYKLLFENEKMHHFNRMYLLFSIVFSLVVPFITIHNTSPLLPTAETGILNTQIFYTYNNTPTPVPVIENNTLPFILLSIYLTVTTVLLFRFGVNLKTLFSRISNSPVIPYKNARLVLINEHLTSHSFLNYIFINRQDYENGKIEDEVLSHELTHVQQKHTIDILFIELVQAIFWFNPVYILYRKAIHLNHEFLADNSVINTYRITPYYQQLLINKASHKNSLLLTSQFNYLITKKRLIMMTKLTSTRKALCRQIALVPLLGISVFLFATEVKAQDSIKAEIPQNKPDEVKPSAWVGLSVGSTKEGVSQELLDEYEAIVNKYKTTDKKWWVDFQKNISKADRERLETIFKQMNKDQQRKQVVVFMRPIPPLPRVVPTKEQLESWKNSKIYGLWINDKRVSNDVLNNYSNADFAQFFVSKLSKNAINYGKHYYQVNVMTKEYYQKYYDQAMANMGNRMYVVIKVMPKTLSHEARTYLHYCG
jgi:bla regulator protein BlaR1